MGPPRYGIRRPGSLRSGQPDLRLPAAAPPHRSTGTTATVTIPTGQTYRAASGWSVLTQDADGALRVLRAAADGTTADLAVTGLPSGARPTGTYATGGSVRRLAVTYTLDGTSSVGLVDLADGTFRTYAEGVGTEPSITFNDSWLVVNRKAIRVDSAPGTAPAAVSFPAKPLAVVGDQLLSGDPDFVSSPDDEALTATSLATGAGRAVLADADGAFRATPDRGLLATAGATASDFHVYRVLPAGDGDVSARPVFTVPPSRAKVDGLMIAGGELLMFGNATPTPGWDAVYAVPLDPTGKPAGIQVRRSPFISSSPCLGGDAACPQLEALGDGRFAYPYTGADGKESVHVTGLATDTYSTEPTGSSGGRIGTGTGRYVLYNGGTSATQKIADFPRGADGDRARPPPQCRRGLGPAPVDPRHHPGQRRRVRPQGQAERRHREHRRPLHPQRDPGRQHLALLVLRQRRTRRCPRPGHGPEHHGPGRPVPARRRLPRP
ncbi:hypothetical protein AB0H92_41500 [Streptomyces phaeochromogenes]|uniref:hypothetical protein n=1 Tax=Streptomyces phaeochromogenes TaxID=1923 RepID=UPI0033D0DF27